MSSWLTHVNSHSSLGRTCDFYIWKKSIHFPGFALGTTKETPLLDSQWIPQWWINQWESPSMAGISPPWLEKNFPTKLTQLREFEDSPSLCLTTGSHHIIIYSQFLWRMIPLHPTASKFWTSHSYHAAPCPWNRKTWINILIVHNI